MDLINTITNIKMNIKMLINNESEEDLFLSVAVSDDEQLQMPVKKNQRSECALGTLNKYIYKRKYNYPSKLFNKNGKLNKSKKKQIYDWRKDIKDNYLNEDIYTKIKLENEKLKSDIEDYQNALETWVLIAQNK